MTTDTKILRFLYSKKSDGNIYDVSKFLPNIPKIIIDNYVVALEKDGFVLKEVQGYIYESQIPPGEDLEHANNSRCRITVQGINYFESFIKSRSNNRLSFIAIIISILALLFTALTYFKN